MLPIPTARVASPHHTPLEKAALIGLVRGPLAWPHGNPQCSRGTPSVGVLQSTKKGMAILTLFKDVNFILSLEEFSTDFFTLNYHRFISIQKSKHFSKGELWPFPEVTSRFPGGVTSVFSELLDVCVGEVLSTSYTREQWMEQENTEGNFHGHLHACLTMPHFQSAAHWQEQRSSGRFRKLCLPSFPSICLYVSQLPYLQLVAVNFINYACYENKICFHHFSKHLRWSFHQTVMSCNICTSELSEKYTHNY